MKILDDIFSTLGSGLDHVGSALGKLVSTEVVYTGRKNTEAQAAAFSPQVSNIVSALAHNETRGVSGDAYKFKQPSGSSTLGDALGRYQTTAGELKSWSKEFYGKIITPEQFMASSTVQDDYTKKKVETLLKAGATPEEIFALHRGGLTGYADPAVRKKKVGERQDYVNSAMDFLKTLGNN